MSSFFKITGGGGRERGAGRGKEQWDGDGEEERHTSERGETFNGPLLLDAGGRGVCWCFGLGECECEGGQKCQEGGGGDELHFVCDLELGRLLVGWSKIGYRTQVRDHQCGKAVEYISGGEGI